MSSANKKADPLSKKAEPESDVMNEEDEQEDEEVEEKTPNQAGAGGEENKKKKKKKKKNKKKTAGDETESREDLEAEAKKWLQSLSEDDIMNGRFFDVQVQDELRQAFRSGSPFPHMRLHDFLDASFLAALEDELHRLEYFHKSNDLFEFAQSHDLKSINSPIISKLKELLYGAKFREFLKSVTGIELTDLTSDVSMSSNVYGDTNTLLCHDDELHGRRIAYILYLVPADWKEEDGGHLDLFDVDKQLQPRKVTKSLVPERNSFACFEVSPVSYHQVREVLTDHKLENGESRVRLSVTGWFHGEPIKRPTPIISPPIQCQPLLEKVDVELDQWISREYRKPNIIKQVRKAFSQDSSIELFKFLRQDKYDELIAALDACPNDEWIETGPANKRKYQVLKSISQNDSSSASSSSSSSSSSTSSAATLLESLHRLFLSTTFSEYIKSITGMETIRGSGRVRRFTPGCYTLAHNEDEERFECALDMTLCITKPPTKDKTAKKKKAGGIGKKAAAAEEDTSSSNVVERWDGSVHGGTIHYIEEGESEELLSVAPHENTLSLVFRAGVPAGTERDLAKAEGRGGVLKFVKYINHKAPGNKVDLDYVFRVKDDENDDDEDEDDDDDEEEEEEEEEEDKAEKKEVQNKKRRT